MHISWLGNTSIRLQTKNFDEDVNVVIDPYKPETGSFPRNLVTNITLYTRGEENIITISGEPFMLSTPGECDSKGVLVTAVEGHDEKSIMFRIDSEQLSLGHLGLTKEMLTVKQKELLSGIDILFIPVGNKKSYDVETAIKVVNELEPRIIIPIAFQSDNDPNAEPIDKFIKAMGVANPEKPETKVIIKKKDLPQDETRIVVLKKE